MFTTKGTGTVKYRVELDIPLEDLDEKIFSVDEIRAMVDTIDLSSIDIEEKNVDNENISFILNIESDYSYYHSDAYFSSSFGNWLPGEDEYECEIDEDDINSAIKDIFKNFDYYSYISSSYNE